MDRLTPTRPGTSNEHGQDRYRGLVERMPAVICELEADGTTAFVNPAITAVTGYDPEALVGRSWWDTLYPAPHNNQIRALRRKFRQGNVIDHEMVHLDRAGEEHWFSWSSANEWSGRRTPSRIIMIGTDITVRRQMAEERERLQEQLFFAQRMESIGSLAGGVAHDFNNLLTAILGCASLVEADLDPSSASLEDVRDIIRAARRGSELTRQLLIYSRKQPTQPKTVDVNKTVRDLGRLLERLIGENIELELSCASSLPTVSIDPGQLEQVLVNLVVNARDAMPNGGKLRVTTGTMELESQLLRRYSSLQPGIHVRLAVTDTGIGMTDEVAARVFEPFFTTKSRASGTGLGLSTVYGIVKQAQGSIWVDSTPGKGSTFEVLLPAADGPRSAQSSGSNEVPAIGRGEVILLVEDEASLRRPMVRYLRQLDYEVLEAGNGSEGLALYEKEREHIDLLVTDLVMPNLSGQELVERVRQLDPDASVLCISGYPAVREGAERTQVADVQFLWKPFTPAKLAAQVRSLLDQRPPRPDTPDG